jgi:predicted O-methyltransferase YrrM
MMEPAYLAKVHREPPPLLLELEQHARHESYPLIARETGRLLSMLVHAMQANRVLDIGAGVGYATLWITSALPVAGRVWAVEKDREQSDILRTYVDRGGRPEATEIIEQTGFEVLSTFQHRQIDIVFVHDDPALYPKYFESALPLLKRSGLVIFDGLLAPEPQNEFIKTFLHYPELDATILPIGGGIGIGSQMA